ncbi:superoxide dismutase family protein [Paractinoplanes durhamensis]|uniref:Superoxide dismutase n=1 Tax=Paractinoplanes durhamensis TaxID=113563 RepID=A0ABQ3Z0B9_9ACTN|nr:superoxide dismutase family protein [Actinoplanes durhamensis]GIE03274.1 hypothetical protein Adu01nite_46240 [Actinoplanes durhamensis]
MLTHALALALPLTMITGAGPVVASGTFQPFTAGATAVTYDPAAVPAGATAQLSIIKTGYETSVRLVVTGLVGGRMYGAHLHTAPCTAVPAEAGPHYQNHPDPVSPSSNPVYANPRNEIWLDFTADATGAATSSASHGWSFRATEPPRSVVLHAEHTHTAPGQAGTAGPRLACLTLPA